MVEMTKHTEIPVFFLSYLHYAYSYISNYDHTHGTQNTQLITEKKKDTQS